MPELQRSNWPNYSPPARSTRKRQHPTYAARRRMDQGGVQIPPASRPGMTRAAPVVWTSGRRPQPISENLAAAGRERPRPRLTTTCGCAGGLESGWRSAIWPRRPPRGVPLPPDRHSTAVRPGPGGPPATSRRARKSAQPGALRLPQRKPPSSTSAATRRSARSGRRTPSAASTAWGWPGDFKQVSQVPGHRLAKAQKHLTVADWTARAALPRDNLRRRLGSATRSDSLAALTSSSTLIAHHFVVLGQASPEPVGPGGQSRRPDPAPPGPGFATPAEAAYFAAGGTQVEVWGVHALVVELETVTSPATTLGAG